MSKKESEIAQDVREQLKSKVQRRSALLKLEIYTIACFCLKHKLEMNEERLNFFKLVVARDEGWVTEDK